MSANPRWPELILTLGIIACVLVILVPLPTQLLDLLLAGNITVAVIVLLTTIKVDRPLDFAVFPTLLLATTLTRLVLNIATTRLILSRGASDHAAAAGGVIQSFGEFVSGNQIAVGVIIFSIIVIVQFVVITKGSTRISEVAARFTLDAMPGRQMAIDADLKAGLIDQETARLKRDELQQQSDFYGAMDGASKFVRGDAIAGILITGINIVGGLAIGLASGMSITQAGETFTKLTIGDGLATQLPGLLIALAAGILISRSSRKSNLSDQLVRQTFARPQVLVITGLFVVSLVFTDLPAIPLLAIGCLCFWCAWRLKLEESKRPPTAPAQIKKSPDPNDVSSYLHVDPIELELGAGLVGLASPTNGGLLLREITRCRRIIAEELGVVLPKVRVRDNLTLADNQYRVLINQIHRGGGEILHDHKFVLIPRGHESAADGVTELGIAVEWITDGAARWVPSEGFQELGNKPGQPAEAVIARHLLEISKQRAADLVSHQSTAFLIEQVRQHSPALVDELVPGKMSLGQVQQVLKLLVSDGVSIRQLDVILETVSDYHDRVKDLVTLAEMVRRRLGSWITSSYSGSNGLIRAVGLSDDLQLWLEQQMVYKDAAFRLQLSAEACNRLYQSLQGILDHWPDFSSRPVLLVNGSIRPAISLMIRARFAQLGVISEQEIGTEARIEKIAVLRRGDVEYCAA